MRDYFFSVVKPESYILVFLHFLFRFSTNPDETFVFFQNEGFRPCSSTANMVVIIQRALAELACEEVSEIETVSKMGYDFKDASVLKKDIASCAKKIKSELVDVEIAIQELGACIGKFVRVFLSSPFL